MSIIVDQHRKKMLKKGKKERKKHQVPIVLGNRRKQKPNFLLG